MGWLALLAGLLFVLAIPLFLVTGSVTWALNDAGLYNGGFERYDVARRTGITNADLRRAGADIRHYFNSGQEPLELRAPVYGVEREIFNEREVAHMRDVKGLVRKVYLAGALALASMLAVMLAGLWWYRGVYRRRLARFSLWGSAGTLALVLTLALTAVAAFDALFLAFHLVSFSNDLWRLDARTDYLLIMFPQGFWFDATLRVGQTTIAGALVIVILSGGYLWYRGRKEMEMLRARSRQEPGKDEEPPDWG
jgi:integral membrane protein (TIGR01906 family)